MHCTFLNERVNECSMTDCSVNKPDKNYATLLMWSFVNTNYAFGNVLKSGLLFAIIL